MLQNSREMQREPAVVVSADAEADESVLSNCHPHPPINVTRRGGSRSGPLLSVHTSGELLNSLVSHPRQ